MTDNAFYKAVKTLLDSHKIPYQDSAPYEDPFGEDNAWGGMTVHIDNGFDLKVEIMCQGWAIVIYIDENPLVILREPQQIIDLLMLLAYNPHDGAAPYFQKRQ